jgi:hypothetical protein
MARGPDKVTHAPPLDEGAGLNPAERDFTYALERIIDRAMDTLRAGQPFVYGIHQSLSPRMIAVLQARYREAGWREVEIDESGTGAYMLVLRP